MTRLVKFTATKFSFLSKIASTFQILFPQLTVIHHFFTSWWTLVNLFLLLEIYLSTFRAYYLWFSTFGSCDWKPHRRHILLAVEFWLCTRPVARSRPSPAPRQDEAAAWLRADARMTSAFWRVFRPFSSTLSLRLSLSRRRVCHCCSLELLA